MKFELSEEDYTDLGRLLRECRTRNFDPTSERWRGIARRIEKGLKSQLEPALWDGIEGKFPPGPEEHEGQEWKFMLMVYGDYPALSEEGRGILSGCLLEEIDKALGKFAGAHLTPEKARLRAERKEEVPW